jgi:probable F420-dependent oxidoreductase
MKFGACLSNYGALTGPQVLKKTAEEAEALGYESVLVTDHVLLPSRGGTPYVSVLETMTSLGYLAAVTERVKIGISSLVLPMRNPAIVAKQLSTIDVLSRGRVFTAVGVGWNEAEFANLGADFHRRGKILDESIRLIRGLWSGQTSFESSVLPQRISSAVLEPKPVQERLTLWIAGTSTAAMKRAIRVGDCWHPDSGPIDKFESMVKIFRDLPGGAKKEVVPRVGLDTRARETWYTGAKGDRQSKLCGDMKENRKILEIFRRTGVTRMVLEVDHNGKTPLGDQLRNLRLFAREFI